MRDRDRFDEPPENSPTPADLRRARMVAAIDAERHRFDLARQRCWLAAERLEQQADAQTVDDLAELAAAMERALERVAAPERFRSVA